MSGELYLNGINEFLPYKEGNQVISKIIEINPIWAKKLCTWFIIHENQEIPINDELSPFSAIFSWSYFKNLPNSVRLFRNPVSFEIDDTQKPNLVEVKQDYILKLKNNHNILLYLLNDLSKERIETAEADLLTFLVNGSVPLIIVENSDDLKEISKISNIIGSKCSVISLEIMKNVINALFEEMRENRHTSNKIRDFFEILQEIEFSLQLSENQKHQVLYKEITNQNQNTSDPEESKKKIKFDILEQIVNGYQPDTKFLDLLYYYWDFFKIKINSTLIISSDKEEFFNPKAILFTSQLSLDKEIPISNLQDAIYYKIELVLSHSIYDFFSIILTSEEPFKIITRLRSCFIYWVLQRWFTPSFDEYESIINSNLLQESLELDDLLEYLRNGHHPPENLVNFISNQFELKKKIRSGTLGFNLNPTIGLSENFNQLSKPEQLEKIIQDSGQKIAQNYFNLDNISEKIKKQRILNQSTNLIIYWTLQGWMNYPNDYYSSHKIEKNTKNQGQHTSILAKRKRKSSFQQNKNIYPVILKFGENKTLFIKLKSDHSNLAEILNFYATKKELNWEDLEGVNNLACILLLNRQWKKAEVLLKRGLKFEPENLKILKNLGDSYKHQKKFKDALKVYEKLLNLEPNKIDSYRNVICIYQIRGENEKIKDLAKKMVHQGFTNFSNLFDF